MVRIAVLAAVVAAVSVVSLPAQTLPPMNLDGEIASIKGNVIMVYPVRGAEESVVLDSKTVVLGREPATINDIKPGDALGVAAKRGPDGSLTATSINIFSDEMWNVVRKGQWPMESGEIMTNAVVTQATALRVDGSTLTMKYNDVSASIGVPANVEIHKLVTESSMGLKPGMHVSIRGTGKKDGSIDALIVSFDKMG